ncbi:sulfotransferase [Flavobacteriaceae bacterium XHP0103]|uniref:sulfotransferase n=1 Tax=Marixanthotalea marina TaxID=2844359 RepID=UPI002989BC40|nr:sulfotransferase [Marixanthotalea marina]MBU3820656.1 sulfotransferase [Marixanthotalea marina]
MKKQPIIIIGMHRSGTSMLTSFIEEKGVFIGKKKAKVNKEAFFFQKINNWILYQLGSTWDSPEAVKYLDDSSLSIITPHVKMLLQSFWSINFLGLFKFLKYRGVININEVWGWKDPRTTLTLKVWKHIFPNAKIIHIYRNPIDVAQSLKVREEKYRIKKKLSFFEKKRIYIMNFHRILFTSSKAINLEEGYNLWKFYVEEAFKADELFSNTIHIKYEDFLISPEIVLKNLSHFLEIKTDQHLISQIASKVDPNRGYAFKENISLMKFYNQIKDDELVKELGYNNL